MGLAPCVSGREYSECKSAQRLCVIFVLLGFFRIEILVIIKLCLQSGKSIKYRISKMFRLKAQHDKKSRFHIVKNSCINRPVRSWIAYLSHFFISSNSFVISKSAQVFIWFFLLLSPLSLIFQA